MSTHDLKPPIKTLKNQHLNLLVLKISRIPKTIHSKYLKKTN